MRIQPAAGGQCYFVTNTQAKYTQIVGETQNITWQISNPTEDQSTTV